MARVTRLLGLLLLGALAESAPAWAAAVLVPDHTFRLGSCGGPEGTTCDWQCGAGKSCSGGGTCALEGANGAAAVIVAKADATPCGLGAEGSVLTLGFALTVGGSPLVLADTAFDLCDRNVQCSGRQPRACGICSDGDPDHELCTSDDGQGNFPCPPDNVVFFCKDPCAGSGPGAEFFAEDDLNIFSAWFSETRQPVPDVIRAVLPGAPAVGRPLVYHSQTQLFPVGDPPVTRACARILYTTQDRPLGVCSGDPTRVCAASGDCAGGDTCLDGTPPGVNPPAPDAIVSQAVCSSGPRTGRPCGDDGDCGGGTCTPLSGTASASFCSGSLGACAVDGDCPGGESCVTCPQPACGDGVLDPGEVCDDGNTGGGDGCDAACAVEPCFQCDRVLGETSSCFAGGVGSPCDADGTACTTGQCDGFGGCVDGGALPACAGAPSGKAKLKLKHDLANPAKSKLAWKWTSAAAFDTSALGAPANTDDVTLCLYDQTGFRFDLRAPAGGTCGNKPCWSTQTGTVKYKDKEATPDGVANLKATSGVAGKGKLVVVGKGATLPLTLPLTPPVRALAVREDGAACWDATYSTPATNDPTLFKAVSD